jgi:hypothetical protein
MSDTIIVALISAGASALVAVTALLLNYRGFSSIDGRFISVERRLDIIQNDLKEFFKAQADHDKRISKLEDK